MILFWLIAAAMLVMASAVVLLPLWRSRAQQNISQDAINTEIYRERLVELERELEQHNIEQSHYERLRTELQQTLLTDVTEVKAQHRTARGARLIGSVIATLIPFLALGYYYLAAYRGEAHDWMQLQAQYQDKVEQAILQPDALPDEVLQDLPNFTRALQAKVLSEGKNNPDSLFLLGMSFLQLELPDQAQDLFRRAYQQNPDRIDIKMGYAQANMMLNDNRLSKESAALLQDVLKTNPHHQGALMMLGFGAFNDGNYKIAITAWKPLLASLDPDSNVGKMLAERIAQAEQLVTQAAMADDSDEPSAATASIAVTVDLAPELKAKLSIEDTLFIFARAASGPPMPLAAIRQPARDFPVQVVLDDNQAMMPSLKLSNFQQVIVGARISKSGGGPTAKPGDFQGLTDTLNLVNGSLSVSLTVDQVVQ